MESKNFFFLSRNLLFSFEVSEHYYANKIIQKLKKLKNYQTPALIGLNISYLSFFNAKGVVSSPPLKKVSDLDSSSLVLHFVLQFYHSSHIIILD